MGSGVTREETFENLLENRLNRERDSDESKSYEILNFAVSGYYPTNQIEVLEDKVLQFRPQTVFYVGHPGRRKACVIRRRTMADSRYPASRGIYS